MHRTALATLFALTLAFLVGGCGRAAKHEDVNAQHYQVRGVVRGFSPDRATIDIQHENIPDFMPSMTMPFSPRDPNEISNLKIGDAIAFRMTVTTKDFWIDQIKTLPRDAVALPEPRPTSSTAAGNSSRLREGNEMPVFSLTNQEGKNVTRDFFKGQPFILTFVFTRCPVPNFCPRMSGNFAELQRAIKSGNGPLARTRLLSITLDPDFDTPAILKQYGEHLQFDPAIWTFATGDPKEIDALTQAFSVYRQTEGGTISHGLATALVGPDGTIRKIWRGNAWTPAEVIQEVQTIR